MEDNLAELRKVRKSSLLAYHSLKRMAKRGSRDGEAPRGVDILVCSLILMEQPWTIIALIVAVVLKKRYRRAKHKLWTPDELRTSARRGLKANPTLATKIFDDEALHTLKAKAWLAEFELACWLVSQNYNGVAPPSALTVERYVSSWGMGPHRKRLSQHLSKFTNPKRWKVWAHYFRKRWGFKLAVLARGPLMSPSDLEKKVFLTPNP
jgi:hypothetical protein